MFQRKKPLSSLLQPYEILSIELPKGFPIKSEGFLLGGYSPQLDLIYLKNVDTPEISEIKEKYGCDDESFSTYIHLHEVEHRSLSGYRLGVILWILQWELLFTFQEALEITPRSIKCVEKLTEMTKLMLRYEKMIALLMKDARVLYEASALFNLQSIFDDNRLYKSIIEYQPTEIKQALKKLKWIYSYGETLPNTVLEIALNIPNPDFTKSMTASQFTLRYGALKRFNQLCHILKNKKIMEESDLVKEARKSKLLVKNKDEFIFPKNEIHDSLIFKRKIKLGEIAELYPPFVDRDDLSEIYLSPDIFYRQALPKKCQASNSIFEVKNVFRWVEHDGRWHMKNIKECFRWEFREDYEWARPIFEYLLILTVLKNQVFEQAKTHNTTKIVNCLEGKFTFCFAKKKSKSRKGSLVDFEEIKCRDCKYYGLVKAARRLPTI